MSMLHNNCRLTNKIISFKRIYNKRIIGLVETKLYISSDDTPLSTINEHQD
jgi:hypothetical protein